MELLKFWYMVRITSSDTIWICLESFKSSEETCKSTACFGEMYFLVFNEDLDKS